MKEQKVVILLGSDIEDHKLQESIADALDVAGIEWDFINSEGVESDLDFLKRNLTKNEIYGKSFIIVNSDSSSHEFDITKTSFHYNDSGDISKFVIDFEVDKDE